MRDTCQIRSSAGEQLPDFTASIRFLQARVSIHFSRIPQSQILGEGGLLAVMLLTSFIPSNSTPVSSWQEVTLLSWIRASVWLPALTVLPGVYLLRFTRFWYALSVTTKVVLAVHLSLVALGLSVLGFFTVRISFGLFPLFAFSFLCILAVAHFVRPGVMQPSKNRSISQGDLILAATIIAVVLIALSVQIAQRYLIPGDVWAGMEPAVQLLSGRDVYQTFRFAQYPIEYGFILAGLSLGSGLPLVNTYVLLFPLAALNTLTFYVVARILFGGSDRISAVAALIYSLGGGLGWLIGVFFYRGTADFWSLSLATQDMYFFSFFWNDIQFFYKSLSLTLALASLLVFRMSLQFDRRSQVALLAALSALFMLFSFLIHIIDVIVFLPLIIAIAVIYGQTIRTYLKLGIFILSFAIFAFLLDHVMMGYYSWLITTKIGGALAITPRLGSIFQTSTILLATSAVFLGFLLFRRVRLPNFVHEEWIKLPILIAIAIAYPLGLLYWRTAPPPDPSLDLSTPFSWFLYVTRYGFIVPVALIGVAMSRWSKILNLTSIWALLCISLGSLWWGNRMNAYLFPILAFWAGVAVATNLSEHPLPMSSVLTSSKKHFFNLRRANGNHLLSAILSIFMLFLTFTSVLYGALYYASSSPTSDDMVRVISWIEQFTPPNKTILVSPIYSLSKGIQTIGDRPIYLIGRLPQVLDGLAFADLTRTFRAHNIGYAVIVSGFDYISPLMRTLLHYSTLVFSSGSIDVFQLPPLNPPGSVNNATVAVDQDVFGLLGGLNGFGWFDNNFTAGWYFSKVNTTVSGHVLTYNWAFSSGNVPEPSMRRLFPSLETNTYPYLIMRYRNTANTSLSALTSVGQIVTLANESGLPAGFVTNVNVPVSVGGFQILVAKLPQNKKIGYVNIWMRNYGHLNGTIGLQINYVGISSSTDLLPEDARFVTMAIPSLWSDNYSIVSNVGAVVKARLLVMAYDQTFLNNITQLAVNGYLFINTTASTPAWGNSWRVIDSGIISGQFSGRSITIVGLTDSKLARGENLVVFASFLLQVVA